MASSGNTGLYRVIGEADVLLYIGVSKHFGVRWQQHAQKKPWWSERRRMTVDWYDTRDEALDAEALAIFAEQPKYNVLHRKQGERLRRIQGDGAERGSSTGRREAREAGLAAVAALGLRYRGLTTAERAAVVRVVQVRTEHPGAARRTDSRRCWSCGAEPGELCRTRAGRLTFYHQPRWERLPPPSPGREYPAEDPQYLDLVRARSEIPRVHGPDAS